MAKVITIIGSGMMGSALAFPAAENGHEVRLVGSPLDNEIIEHGQKTGEHLNLSKYRKNNDTSDTRGDEGARKADGQKSP